MPCRSMGFCVASTKKGWGSLCVSRPTVTAYSCIASSMADCVRGVARLISSARIRWAKIGPGWKVKPRPSLALYDNVRAHDVGGHQVGRELDAAVAQVHALGQRAHQ